jgi:hypothetical protein
VRWFRQNVDVTALARDHGVSRATGYRYLDEVITVLAEQARTCTTPCDEPRTRA